VSDEPPIASDQDVSADAERRLSFGSVAEQYDRHRPGYPPQLVDDILTYADAHAGDRALEVGAGTGRATLMFAQRGLKVMALEPDVDMAAVASERAATAGLTIDMITSDFETAFEAHALPEHAFKLLFSGTAWHWVTPSLRNELATRTRQRRDARAVLEPAGVGRQPVASGARGRLRGDRRGIRGTAERADEPVRGAARDQDR
jgi:SAM-dependent methyltransferase